MPGLGRLHSFLPSKAAASEFFGKARVSFIVSPKFYAPRSLVNVLGVKKCFAMQKPTLNTK